MKKRLLGHINLVASHMDTIETLLTRKSSPRLSEPSPSKDELEIIFQTALRAPDHASLKPWKFIKVSGEGRKKLADASLSALKKIDAKKASENEEKILNAPFRAPLIIIVVSSVKDHHIVPEIEQILSAGAAAQNMLIAAHSMGYSGIWRTGLISFNKEVSKSFNLNDNDIVIGYLYIGTPEKEMTLPLKSNTNDFVINWD
ncbi:MAG: nitroreductase [Alphaproteobacteria bacterium]|jgi:nitroreductase|nr:nitroreductase [Alphaproteobacteria bacterium]